MNSGNFHPRELYLSGREALQNGDQSLAIELISNALELSPENVSWRISLGQILLSTGRISEALNQFHHAVDLDPLNAKAFLLLGRAYGEAENHAAARDAVEQAVKLDSDNVGAWATLGRLYIDLDQLEDARSAYEKAADLDPQHVASHLALADLAAKSGESRTEVHHRCTVADLRLDHVPSQILYANSLMNVGRYAEARKRYLLISRLRPHDQAASAVADELQRWIDSGRPPGGVVSVDYYDDIYSTSDSYSKDGADLSEAKHFAVICDLLQNDGARKVVDLGCGPGQFAQYLRSRTSIPYTGIDYSSVAIQSAIDRGIENAHFLVRDIVQNPEFDYPAGSSIVCTEVLEHIDDISLIRSLPANHDCYFSVPSFHTFGHIRHFSNSDEVKSRYSPFFDNFSVQELPIGRGKNRLYVFSGRRLTEE